MGPAFPLFGVRKLGQLYGTPKFTENKKKQKNTLGFVEWSCSR